MSNSDCLPDRSGQYCPTVDVIAMASKIPLAVIIPVENAAQNLPVCLDALGHGWNEIFVVNSGSSDQTIEIAKNTALLS